MMIGGFFPYSFILLQKSKNKGIRVWFGCLSATKGTFMNMIFKTIITHLGEEGVTQKGVAGGVGRA